MPTFVDLFCGCGGASSGFRAAGWTPVCAVDTDERALATYASNFPHATTLLGDLTDEGVQSRLEQEVALSVEGGSVDAVVGGPPCQGFSRRNSSTQQHDPMRLRTLQQ